jgi:hypothetical protein
MKEHLDDVKRFPCKYCKKYRGQNGFKRKDHLTQHLRGYHHIGEGEGKFRYEFPLYDKTFCRHPDCPESQNNWVRRGVAFKKVSDCTTHMKTVHNESDFPCPEPGCDRVGGKGYFRKVDLRRHITKVHGTDDKLVEGEDQ